MTTLLIPGLLCDRFVWEPVLARMDAEVADLTSQAGITAMARHCLDRYSGKLRVAGHSMGGRVAMEMARLAPGRIDRLALLDTGMHPLREGEHEKREEIIAFANTNGMEALAARWLPPMVHAPNRTPALMAGLTAMVLRMDEGIHERQIRALIGRPDASLHIGEITCPVLLIAGSEDSWSPPAQHEDIRALVPHAKLVIVEGAGHFAPVEKPEEVAGVLCDFLQADKV